MIVDIHAHAWPYLGDARYGSISDRMRAAQRHTIWHTQGPRRVTDGAFVERQTLFDGKGSGASNLCDVNFRPGDLGRLQWTAGGEDLYLQWMPPTLQRLEVPPELMIAHMDYVGVAKGVLSRAHLYGELNDYTAETVRRFPGRFAGACQIDEWRAHENSQIDELYRSAEQLGLRILYFEGTEAFFRVDNRERYDAEKFSPFWHAVRELRMPILWDIRCQHKLEPADFAEQIDILAGFARRFPEIQIVITHAFNMRFFPQQKLTAQTLDLCRLPNIHVELLLPIMNGRFWDYPFPEAQEVVKTLYNEVGPQRLMWGSDMPAVERVCTYKQSLDYLRRYCTFIGKDDMGAILGGNAVRLFNLQ